MDGEFGRSIARFYSFVLILALLIFNVFCSDAADKVLNQDLSRAIRQDYSEVQKFFKKSS